jgi:hypothetical protein
MITLKDFLERFGNLELCIVPHRAPWIFEASCIARFPGRPNDHHSIASTPEEAIEKLYFYLDRLTTDRLASPSAK